VKIWLCPIKPTSWRVIRKEEVFGVPIRWAKRISQVKRGDILVFHVVGRPVSGIVALARVRSSPFESYQNLWGEGRYPLRVRVEIMPGYIRERDQRVPLSSLYGKNGDGDVVVEPYLRNVCLARITLQQYRELKSFFEKRAVAG
jgi:hypothetical protein